MALPFVFGSLGVVAVLLLVALLAVLLVLLCRKTSDTYEGTGAYCISRNELSIFCVSLLSSCLQSVSVLYSWHKGGGGGVQ